MNSDLFQTIEPDPPIDVYHDLHDAEGEDMAAHELENERMYDIECALRECLTRGVSMKNIRVLCAETGIEYRRVVGG